MIDRAPPAALDERLADPARRRALLVELYNAAVAGAAPGPITSDALRDLDVRPAQRLWLLAFGKAAHPMAAAAVSSLEREGRSIAAGVVIAPDDGSSRHSAIIALAGDHPIPGRRSLAAAQRAAAPATSS